MIPHKWPVLRAAPPLEKRLEIMQAIEALSGQIEAGRLRQRQAEIVARRRLIEEIELTVHELWCRYNPRGRSYVLKYDPNEPRVPAGNPRGGQWTSGGGSAQVAAGPGRPGYPIDLNEEEALGGHYDWRPRGKEREFPDIRCQEECIKRR